MIYLVCYDICSEKRRYEVKKTLKDYGIRVQYSVFECDLTIYEFNKLRQKLKEIISPDVDSVRFYSLCKVCYKNLECVGDSVKIEKEDFYLI